MSPALPAPGFVLFILDADFVYVCGAGRNQHYSSAELAQADWRKPIVMNNQHHSRRRIAARPPGLTQAPCHTELTSIDLAESGAVVLVSHVPEQNMTGIDQFGSHLVGHGGLDHGFEHPDLALQR